MITRKFIIRGKVQGVFFRQWTASRARQLGVDGWVRNRSSGEVEGVAVGEAGAVEALITDLHEGPPAARVEQVEVQEMDVEPLSGFEVKPTL